MTNLERAERARQALAWVRKLDSVKSDSTAEDEGDLADLLADLMHLARLTTARQPVRAEAGEYARMEWDFEAELERARRHFATESKAPSWRKEYSPV